MAIYRQEFRIKIQEFRRDPRNWDPKTLDLLFLKICGVAKNFLDMLIQKFFFEKFFPHAGKVCKKKKLPHHKFLKIINPRFWDPNFLILS